MSNFAMVSTGDPERDRRELARFGMHDALIKRGECPNHCGPMTRIDSHNDECPTCGFVAYTNVARN